MASSFIYDITKTLFGTGENWSTASTGVYYITLLSNNYVPNPGHSYASNFSGAELNSISFTSGFAGTLRISMTSRSVFSNTTSHVAEFRAADVSWTGLSAGVAHAYSIVKHVGSDGTSPIMVYCSTGGFPITTNGGNFAISFTSNVVWYLQDA